MAGIGVSPRPANLSVPGQTYSYLHHWYNLTWLNERRVEIPIIRAVLEQERDVRLLEIGNVLSHYDRTLVHPVVDRYQRPNRENAFAEDAETFTQGAPYDLILSISTFEHIGHDDLPRDEDKIRRTAHHVRGLLSLHGSLVFTAPIGYSPSLDKLVDEGDCSSNDAVYAESMRRTSGLRRIGARSTRRDSITRIPSRTRLSSHGFRHSDQLRHGVRGAPRRGAYFRLATLTGR